MAWRAAAVAILFAGVLAAVAPGGQSSANAAKVKRCRDVIIRNPDGSVYTRTHGLFAIRTSCSKARRVARIYLHRAEGNGSGRPVRPLGFTCSGGSDGVACHKGRRRVSWGYYYD
jgi:hypothetical protein